MTRVVITGAAGFLGRRLTRAIAGRGTLGDRHGRQEKVTRLTLVDVVDMAPPSCPGITVEVIKGDLADQGFVDRLGGIGFDSLFHLASLLTFRAEEAPDLAYAVNVSALRHLIEAAADRPKVIFTSSIAVFGGEATGIVGDEVAPVPQTTYGSHKAINELLIADASRRGCVDGRSLRLPIVLTRPGVPQAAVADRIASIIREPLNGIDVAAPLDPTTRLPLCSAGAVVRALLTLHDIPAADLPARRAFNLPSLSVGAAELADAVQRRGATGAITFAPDARLQAIVDGWPKQLVSAKARALGLAADDDIDALIGDYLDHRDI